MKSIRKSQICQILIFKFEEFLWKVYSDWKNHFHLHNEIIDIISSFWMKANVSSTTSFGDIIMMQFSNSKIWNLLKKNNQDAHSKFLAKRECKSIKKNFKSVLKRKKSKTRSLLFICWEPNKKVEKHT